MDDCGDCEKCQVTVVCAGPPYCEYEVKEAIRVIEEKGGCPWCAKIYTEPDGREFIEQPGTA